MQLITIWQFLSMALVVELVFRSGLSFGKCLEDYR